MMQQLEELYQQVILEHAQLKNGYVDHVGENGSYQVNPTCGDEVTLEVELADDTLKRVSWTGQGCSISQASLSMMTQLVQGQNLDEVQKLDAAFSELMHSRGKGVSEEVLDQLGDASALEGTSRFVNRVKCALLGWMALKDAIAKAQAGQGIATSEGSAAHCDVQ